MNRATSNSLTTKGLSCGKILTGTPKTLDLLPVRGGFRQSYGEMFSWLIFGGTCRISWVWPTLTKLTGKSDIWAGIQVRSDWLWAYQNIHRRSNEGHTPACNSGCKSVKGWLGYISVSLLCDYFAEIMPPDTMVQMGIKALNEEGWLLDESWSEKIEVEGRNEKTYFCETWRKFGTILAKIDVPEEEKETKNTLGWSGWLCSCSMRARESQKMDASIYRVFEGTTDAQLSKYLMEFIAVPVEYKLDEDREVISEVCPASFEDTSS